MRTFTQGARAPVASTLRHMDDEFRQFVIAEALLSHFGGRPESAWTLAGELLKEGRTARDVFAGLEVGSWLEQRFRTVVTA